VAGGEWSLLLRLAQSGWNSVEFVARNSGGTASQAIQIFYTEVEESVKGGACYNIGVCS
jgi:hypothetical protein